MGASGSLCWFIVDNPTRISLSLSNSLLLPVYNTKWREVLPWLSVNVVARSSA